MFDKEKSAKEESVKEEPLLNITGSSGSNTTVSTESDHDINHVSDKEMFQDDQWADHALAQMIRDKHFDQLKALFDAKDKSNEETIRLVALKICDATYRQNKSISPEIAYHIAVESVDQLESMGVDTTEVISAALELKK